MTVYSEYSRDKIGWFFGLGGFQFSLLAIASLPFFWAIKNAAWLAAGTFLLIWLTLAAVTIIPVRGRSATGWLLATLAYSLGGLTGWTRFQAQASIGATKDLDEPDLPGRLQGIAIHDGPPSGGSQSRIAIIQDNVTRSWAVTAAVTHPGIGMAETDERDRLGAALANLIDIAGRTELIDELIFLVRTVPDDGAERELWVRRHRSDNAPQRARRTNDELADWLTQASVRTEQYVTIVVPETNLAKHAKEAGGGLDGRARTLYLLLAEIGEHLIGGPVIDLPKPWDPETCADPELRKEVWAWLDDVVTWLNHEYTWDVLPLVPSCWPLHPHVVHEIAVVADQRRRTMFGLTSDPLEEWHRYVLPSFIDRMRARLKDHCADGHKAWPARGRYIRHISEDSATRRESAYVADRRALSNIPSTAVGDRQGVAPKRLSIVDTTPGEILDDIDH